MKTSNFTLFQELRSYFRNLGLGVIGVTGMATSALAATNPTPQALPYMQDFGSAHIPTGYLATAGMQFSRAGSGSFKTSVTALESAFNAASMDASFTDRDIRAQVANTADTLIARAVLATPKGKWNTNNGVSPLSYLKGTDAKLMFSLGTRVFQNVLSINTTGKTDVQYKYDVQLVEYINGTSLGSPVATGSLVLQYRVGNTADWTTIPNTTYTSSGIIDSKVTFTGYLPVAAENKAEVQIRWISIQSADTDLADYISFTLDNITIKEVPKVNVLYKEDFEMTNRSVLGPNGNFAAIPSSMKMYNLDGKLSTSADGYPKYGLDAWVMIRRSSKSLTAAGADDIAQYTSTTSYSFDNSGSNFADSNWVAASTSFFTDDQTVPANRWLTTPAIKLEGDNLKFSMQALSGTSSGNYEDQFQILYSQVAPGATINVSDWEALPVRNTILLTDSVKNSAPTVPITYEVPLSAAFKDQTVYFAVRLITGKVFGSTFGGDRLYIDNIKVTSTGTVTALDLNNTVASSPLSVYPNPASEALSLSFNTKISGAASVTFLSASGVPSATTDLGFLPAGPQLLSASLSSLASGLYIAKIQSASGLYIAKFFKN